MTSVKRACDRSRTSTPIESTEMASDGHQMSDTEWTAMLTVLNAIYDHRTEDGTDPSKLFHRRVNKRVIPEYYETIKEPVALSTIKQKINTRAYVSFAEFVRDFALIPHNAQVFNRPDSGAFQDSLIVKEVLERQLELLVRSGVISADNAKLPDLGEIPAYEEPEPVEGDVEQDDEEDSEEEVEAEDDEEEEGEEEDVPKRKRGRPRGSVSVKKEIVEDNVEGKRTRGRPPRLLTPEEARIQAILKGIRKPKNAQGQYLISNFERLPDKQVMPEYYVEVRHPMAYDVLKKKVKRKKYKTVEEFMADVNLMFDNAKGYNTDESQIYREAVTLQIEAGKLYDIEKAKPDDDFADDEGKIPMPNGILHNGDLYKTGDWIHVQNPNDLTKPIPGQIYRTYKAQSGQQMVNVCWYYRPEWTVHRFDKHFLPSEVVKTGRYKDHNIEEVEGKCFIMFFTRFFKGRPRGLPQGVDVYVCEARYNETAHQFNKIKTWASCLPDEVRDKDYEMDLFEHPKRMKKNPSPIAYLLKPEQQETDELPKPQWGADGAPPKIGAVHRRPRGEKDSPPPEPTPPPPKISTPPLGQPVSTIATGPSASIVQSQQQPRPVLSVTRTPSLTAAHPQSYMQPPASIALQHQLSLHAKAPQTPQSLVHKVAPQSSTYQQTPPSTSHSSANPSRVFAPSNYRDPPSIETYVLPDHANLSIPYEIRQLYHQDAAGRILFFTAPPVPNGPSDVAESSQARSHSVRYLVAKSRRGFAGEQRLGSNKRTGESVSASRATKTARNLSSHMESDIGRVQTRALETLRDQMRTAVATELCSKDARYLSPEQKASRERQAFLNSSRSRRVRKRRIQLGNRNMICIDD